MEMFLIFQVKRKISEIQNDGANVGNDHEDPAVFSHEHDQQLLQWMNRYTIAYYDISTAKFQNHVVIIIQSPGRLDPKLDGRRRRSNLRLGSQSSRAAWWRRRG
jgi:hypothetical protein